jgi:hypothetical protein
MDERMRIKEKIRGRKKPSTSFRKDLFDSTQEGGKLTGSMKEFIPSLKLPKQYSDNGIS